MEEKLELQKEADRKERRKDGVKEGKKEGGRKCYYRPSNMMLYQISYNLVTMSFKRKMLEQMSFQIFT